MSRDATEWTVSSVAPAQMSGVPAGVERLEFRSGVDGASDWALVRPPAAGGDGTWLVMVHGHGSAGDQLYTRPDLRDQWLPAFLASGVGIVSPNVRGPSWMGPAAAADLHALLAWLRAERSARRFLFASGSMGGSSNLVYAVVHPADVAGLIALCPATDLTTYQPWCAARGTGVWADIAGAIARAYGGPPHAAWDVYTRHSAVAQAARLTMPVYIVHGTADYVIPVAQARRLAGALADHPRFVYEEIAAGHHDSPLPAMPRAWTWLLKNSQ